MSQPSKYNPLDVFVYPSSNNWTPSMKQRGLGYLGDPLTFVDKRVTRPVRLPRYNKTIDFVEKRRNERTALLNMKATQFENLINDDIEQNAIELQYKKQQDQLAKLSAIFSTGIFSNLFANVESKLLSNIQSDFLQNDPDISNFDRESGEVINLVNNVNKLRDDNTRLEEEAIRLRGDLENALKQEALKAQTPEELESLSDLYGVFNEIEEVVKSDESEGSGAEGAGIDLEDIPLLTDELLDAKDRIDTIEQKIDRLNYVKDELEKQPRLRRTKTQIAIDNARQNELRQKQLTIGIPRLINEIRRESVGITLPRALTNRIARFENGNYDRSSYQTIDKLATDLFDYVMNLQKREKQD